jgi:hypothetical protein
MILQSSFTANTFLCSLSKKSLERSSRVAILLYSSSSFKSSRFAVICWIAFKRLEAYFRNKSLWLPDHTSILEPPTLAVTLTRIGYLSVRFGVISQPGNTLLTQSAAVWYSWWPPSQLRLCEYSDYREQVRRIVHWHSVANVASELPPTTTFGIFSTNLHRWL